MTLDEGGWRRSAVRVVAPPAALSGIVELVWIDEWSEVETSGRQFRIVADDSPHLLWYASRDLARGVRRMSLVGARACHHDVDLSGRQLLIGARLCPGALPLLTPLPAIRLTNRSVPLTELVDRSSARSIRHMTAAGPDAAVDQLATLIASLARRGSSVDSRVAWIGGLDRDARTSVGEIERVLGMPARTLRAWSLAHFGMGLKRLLRIRRLHAALELWLSGAHDSWTRVAAAAGYADQPHLIRDCRALLGQAPAAFVARAG
jgi:AraC-like DNA-binding protein